MAAASGSLSPFDFLLLLSFEWLLLAPSSASLFAPLDLVVVSLLVECEPLLSADEEALFSVLVAALDPAASVVLVAECDEEVVAGVLLIAGLLACEDSECVELPVVAAVVAVGEEMALVAGDGVAVPSGVGEMRAVADGEAEGIAVAEGEAVAEGVMVAEGEALTVAEGEVPGATDAFVCALTPVWDG